VYTGNVEILHHGKWGSICDDEWDDLEAGVVCRQLGFNGAIKATANGHFGQARSETRYYCFLTLNLPKILNILRRRVASDTEKPFIPLCGRNSTLNAYLESHHPTYLISFSLISILFDRSLRAESRRVHGFLHESFLKGRYWMDNVYCDGTEDELARCRFDGWAVSDCDSNEAAGVICTYDEEVTASSVPQERSPKVRIKDTYRQGMALRLSGGRVRSEGQVEVKLGNAGRERCLNTVARDEVRVQVILMQRRSTVRKMIEMLFDRDVIE